MVGGRRLRVLIADDDDWIRNILVRILTDANHEAHAVSGGDDAARELLSETYDCALLDFQMPDRGALDIATQYAALGRHRTPIVVLTADASVETTKRCLAVGVRKVLSKPIGAQQILDAVSEAVDGADTQALALRRSEEANVETISQRRLADLRKVYREDKSLSEAIRSFLAQANSLTDRLVECVRAANTEELERIAHKLEGSAGTFGAAALEQLCGEIRTVPVALLSLQERETWVIRLRDCLSAVSAEFDQHFRSRASC
jgi:two-component system sensor histidine kinase RpfC